MTSTTTTQQGTQGMTNRSGASMTELKHDAAAVKSDLNSLKSDTAQLTSHATEQAIDAVKAGAQSAAEVAKSFGESAKRCHGAASDTISARPMTSVLVAAGVGIVVGRLLSRR